MKERQVSSSLMRILYEKINSIDNPVRRLHYTQGAIDALLANNNYFRARHLLFLHRLIDKAMELAHSRNEIVY